MKNYQLEELKNIVSELNLNNVVDSLEAEMCDACCQMSGGGNNEPPKHETQQKLQNEIQS